MAAEGLCFFTYVPPEWSVGDRLVAFLEVDSDRAHRGLLEALEIASPRWLVRTRRAGYGVQGFGWYLRVEVGPDDPYAHLTEADYALARRLDAALARPGVAACEDLDLEPDVPRAPGRRDRDDGERRILGRVAPDRSGLVVVTALPRRSRTVSHRLPFASVTSLEDEGGRALGPGALVPGDVAVARATQARLADGMFGQVASRVVVSRATAGPTFVALAALCRAAQAEDAPSALELAQLHQLAQARTGVSVSAAGWAEERTRALLDARSVAEPGGARAAVARHLGFLDRRALPLGFAAHRAVVEVERSMAADAWTRDGHAAVLRPLVFRSSRGAPGLCPVELPPRHHLGAAVALAPNELVRLAEARSLIGPVETIHDGATSASAALAGD